MGFFVKIKFDVSLINSTTGLTICQVETDHVLCFGDSALRLQSHYKHRK